MTALTPERRAQLTALAADPAVRGLGRLLDAAEAEVERLREHDHICSAIIQANDDMGAAIARVRALCDDAERVQRTTDAALVYTDKVRAAIDGGDDE